MSCLLDMDFVNASNLCFISYFQFRFLINKYGVSHRCILLHRDHTRAIVEHEQTASCTMISHAICEPSKLSSPLSFLVRAHMILGILKTFLSMISKHKCNVKRLCISAEVRIHDLQMAALHTFWRWSVRQKSTFGLRHTEDLLAKNKTQKRHGKSAYLRF